MTTVVYEQYDRGYMATKSSQPIRLDRPHNYTNSSYTNYYNEDTPDARNPTYANLPSKSRSYRPHRSDYSSTENNQPQRHRDRRAQGVVPRLPPERDREPQIDNPNMPQLSLEQIIALLDDVSDSVKQNAASYLQHLTFNNEEVKARVRELNGINPLINLLYQPNVAVQKSGTAVLRNLSHGSNALIKREIVSRGGLGGLMSLLESPGRDSQLEESVTGVLWNLSACSQARPRIMAECLEIMVRVVIAPHSTQVDGRGDGVYWSTLFRNASGIIRNLSSDDQEARNKLRDCPNLVESLLFTIRSAIGNSDIDNKSVENCVCILRNMSFALQEIVDTSYLHRKRHNEDKPAADKTSLCGCCVSGKKKSAPSNPSQPSIPEPAYGTVRGRNYLWQPSIIERVYLPLLNDCSNPDTLEAAAGAVQNLTACEWEPSIAIRTQVRKEKGLAILVDLLNLNCDRVVGTCATALRNLAIDFRNRELIGTYALDHLIACLPTPELIEALPTSLNTISAVLATIFAIIKNNDSFARAFLEKSGVVRCHHLIQSGLYEDDEALPPERYRVPRFASQILKALWDFKKLRSRFLKAGWREQDMLAGYRERAGSERHRSRMSKSVPRQESGTAPRVQRSASNEVLDQNRLAYESSSGRPSEALLLPPPESSGDYGYSTGSTIMHRPGSTELAQQSAEVFVDYHPSRPDELLPQRRYDEVDTRLNHNRQSSASPESSFVYDNPLRVTAADTPLETATSLHRNPYHHPFMSEDDSFHAPMRENLMKATAFDEESIASPATHPIVPAGYPCRSQSSSRATDKLTEPLYAEIDRQKKLTQRNQRFYFPPQVTDVNDTDSWV